MGCAPRGGLLAGSLRAGLGWPSGVGPCSRTCAPSLRVCAGQLHALGGSSRRMPPAGRTGCAREGRSGPQAPDHFLALQNLDWAIALLGDLADLRVRPAASPSQFAVLQEPSAALAALGGRYADLLMERLGLYAAAPLSPAHGRAAQARWRADPALLVKLRSDAPLLEDALRPQQG